MLQNQFSSRILQYLESNNKTLDEVLLEEASKRVSFAFKRQVMENRSDSKGILRMSSGGHCARKTWYSYKGECGKPLSGRTMNTFLMGDICEVGLSVLGRLAGWQLMGKPDGEDALKIQVEHGSAGEPPQEPYTVVGHPDDLLFVPEENEYYLVEYKSASEYSYRSFEKDGLSDDWGYWTQVSLYMKALGVNKCIVVYMCKNTGHICDRIVEMNPELVEVATNNWHAILNKDEMPCRKYDAVPETKYNRSKKEYETTGRMTLEIQCQYCQFVEKCWPDVRIELKGEKPVFVISDAVTEMAI